MHPFLSRALFLPTFIWNFGMARVFHRRNWWDRVDEHVILGALPLRRDVPRMADQGVRGVINMCREYRGPLTEYARFGIEQLWLPTVDFNPPSFEDTCKGVEFLEDHAQLGQVVYVHCKAGRARSATVVICWLIKYKRMSPEDAQLHLIQCRPHVNAKLLERPVVQQFIREQRGSASL